VLEKLWAGKSMGEYGVLTLRDLLNDANIIPILQINRKPKK
jgi:hypothetical protein